MEEYSWVHSRTPIQVHGVDEYGHPAGLHRLGDALLTVSSFNLIHTA